METFSPLLALCAGNSPASQWRGALVFSFFCAWTNGWVNNRDASDFKRHRARYDVTVMLAESPCSNKTIGQNRYILFMHYNASNHRQLDCLFNNFLGLTTMKTSKLSVAGSLWGNPPVIKGFPPKRASNADHVSVPCLFMLKITDLATLIRAFWPPLSICPRSPTIVLSPWGHLKRSFRNYIIVLDS